MILCNARGSIRCEADAQYASAVEEEHSMLSFHDMPSPASAISLLFCRRHVHSPLSPAGELWRRTPASSWCHEEREREGFTRFTLLPTALASPIRSRYRHQLLAFPTVPIGCLTVKRKRPL
ncbi:hypothetical protein BHE74_00043893 [Ensete ventricosum]|nr:hypothetical protein BHE74_00043893 [Ensete ventricosum]